MAFAMSKETTGLKGFYFQWCQLYKVKFYIFSFLILGHIVIMFLLRLESVHLNTDVKIFFINNRLSKCNNHSLMALAYKTARLLWFKIL
jgi:hypothetical protein